MTTRRQWRAALRSDAFPRDQRVVRGTLLLLVDLVDQEGELHRWREEIAAETGLPSRTLNNHLKRAVTLGWLVLVVRGGNGRRSLYRVAIPEASCGPKVAHNSGSCEPSTRTQLRKVVSHLVAQSEQTEREQGELVALDEHRDRRADHDDARGSRRRAVE